MRLSSPIADTAALLLALLTGLLLAACAGEPPPTRVVHDLAADLTAAERAWEPGVYDLGTPAARAALLHGWGDNETAGGRSWVWALGDESALELFLAAPRDLVLELTVQPFEAPGLPAQRLALEISAGDTSTPLPGVELRSGVQEYRVPVPATALRAGRSRLTVRPAWSRAPSEVSDSRDHRPLAAAWYRLRILEAGAAGPAGAAGAADDDDGDDSGDGGPVPGPPPRASADARLHLPAGSRVDYHLALPAGSRLAADRLVVRDGATLDVGLRRRGGQAVWLRRGIGAEESLDVPLLEEDGGTGLARLRLRVPPGTGGVILEKPRAVVFAEATAEGPDGSASVVEDGAGERTRHPTPHRRPDLVLYVIDTLRADAVGAYGAESGATPRLDAFAGESIVFERARAQSSWTQPSVASLFTGLWPAAHGVISGETRLPTELPSLPELLQHSGYRTAAVVANGYVSEDFGFDRGFDHFLLLPDLHTRAGAVQAAALDWLDGVAGDDAESGDERPFFLYLHTIDPHAPYDPPPEMAARFAPGIDPALGTVERLAALADRKEVPSDATATAASLGALYTGDVAWQDREIGRFFDALAARGLYDGAALVVVSDHGEEFAEHGRWTHGLNLHRETVDVPLLLRLPGGEAAGTRVAEPVQHVDVPGTLLALAGLDAAAALHPAPGPGAARRDLRRIARGETVGTEPSGREAAADDDAREGGVPEGRPVFSHLDRFSTAGASVELGRWKLILPLSRALGDEPRLYDRLADPGELRDLARRDPVLAGWLASLVRRELAAAREAGTMSPDAEVDEETRERLKALGYLR